MTKKIKFYILAIICVILICGLGFMLKTQQLTSINKNTEVKTTSMQSVKKEQHLKIIKEGVHYDVLNDELQVKNDKPSITEFFWLGCGHCQAIDPLLTSWVERVNEEHNVDLIKIAVPGSARWSYDAKVFYELKSQGGKKNDFSGMSKLYMDLMQKSYEAPTKGSDGFPSELNIEKFFTKLGFDAKAATLNINKKDSFKRELAYAEKEFVKTGAAGTPTFVINGKYKLRFDHIESNDDIYEIIKALTYKK